MPNGSHPRKNLEFQDKSHIYRLGPQMSEDTAVGPFSNYLDLVERELRIALADLDRLRSLEKLKEAAKGRYVMLKAALDSCGHFLRKLEPLLE